MPTLGDLTKGKRERTLKPLRYSMNAAVSDRDCLPFFRFGVGSMLPPTSQTSNNFSPARDTQPARW
jgi:hypothetical protein